MIISVSRLGLLLLAGSLLSSAAPGCGENDLSLIQQTTPLNGVTSVDISTRPGLTVATDAQLNLYPPEARKVVLYDVTGGARIPLKGQVEWEGNTLEYLVDPSHNSTSSASNLRPGRDYQLEMLKSALTLSGIDAVDTSEGQQEPVLRWPYKLWFSTATVPRVRAAYLDRGARKSITVHFSQQMNPIVTGPAISVVDVGSKAVPQAAAPAWIGDRGVRIRLKTALDPAGIYTLRVSAAAQGQNGTGLDGDVDGRAGGAFSIKFTGSQEIIRSRLPR